MDDPKRTFRPLHVSESQRRNLETLWARSPQTVPQLHFDVRSFCRNAAGELLAPADLQHAHSACMVGRGPACGITDGLEGGTWGYYMETAFTNTHKYQYNGYDDPRRLEFDWLFGGGWCLTDDTFEGARTRLRVALDQGIPSDAEEQRRRQVPLMYTAG